MSRNDSNVSWPPKLYEIRKSVRREASNDKGEESECEEGRGECGSEHESRAVETPS